MTWRFAAPASHFGTNGSATVALDDALTDAPGVRQGFAVQDSDVDVVPAGLVRPKIG